MDVLIVSLNKIPSDIWHLVLSPLYATIISGDSFNSFESPVKVMVDPWCPCLALLLLLLLGPSSPRCKTSCLHLLYPKSSYFFLCCSSFYIFWLLFTPSYFFLLLLTSSCLLPLHRPLLTGFLVFSRFLCFSRKARESYAFLEALTVAKIAPPSFLLQSQGQDIADWDPAWGQPARGPARTGLCHGVNAGIVYIY